MKPVAAQDPRQLFAAVPFTRLLGVRRDFSEGGRSQFTLEARPELGNVVGTMHGGVVCTMLDVAMASAAVSKLDFTRTAVSLNLDISFLEPGRGALTAVGEVIAHDESVAMCQGIVTDAEGRRVAQGLASFRYVPFPRNAPSTHQSGDNQP